MSVVTSEERGSVRAELSELADEFAARAQAQEAARDRAHPGTGSHHQFAHSATLWRIAEHAARTRAVELHVDVQAAG